MISLSKKQKQFETNSQLCRWKVAFITPLFHHFPRASFIIPFRPSRRMWSEHSGRSLHWNVNYALFSANLIASWWLEHRRRHKQEICLFSVNCGHRLKLSTAYVICEQHVNLLSSRTHYSKNTFSVLCYFKVAKMRKSSFSLLQNSWLAMNRSHVYVCN